MLARDAGTAEGALSLVDLGRESAPCVLSRARAGPSDAVFWPALPHSAPMQTLAEIY